MSELMVIAVIALIVVGPKDLPKMLRSIAKFVTKLRSMAGEFQRHLDSAIRETGIEDVGREVKKMTNFTVTSDVGKKMSDEFKRQGDEINKILAAPEKPLVEKQEDVSASATPEPATPAAATPEPAIVTAETKVKAS
jgi:sec-independent protein translocase protein TatB